MRGWIRAPAAPISPFRSLVRSRALRHNKACTSVIRPLPTLTMCTSQKSPLFPQLNIGSVGTRQRVRLVAKGHLSVKSGAAPGWIWAPPGPGALINPPAVELDAWWRSCSRDSALIPAEDKRCLYNPRVSFYELHCFRAEFPRAGRPGIVQNDSGVRLGGIGRRESPRCPDRSHRGSGSSKRCAALRTDLPLKSKALIKV